MAWSRLTRWSLSVMKGGSVSGSGTVIFDSRVFVSRSIWREVMPAFFMRSVVT